MSVKAAQEIAVDMERPSGQDFPALEEKIYKAIELLKSARAGQAAAERDSNRLREQLEEREEELETLRSEIVTLRKERETVRERVEKMLKQMDALLEQG
jgi:septation ring formation regulator EzrA